MVVGVEEGLLPSYNERVAQYIYIYIGETFLDKESKLLSVLRSGSASNYEGPFSLRLSPLPQPSWDGSGRAKQGRARRLLRSKDISLTHERVNVLAVGPLFGRKGSKGVVLGEFRKGEGTERKDSIV